MLLWLPRSLCLQRGRRFLTNSGLTPRLLKNLNAPDTRYGKLCAALDSHLYALAALIALKNPPVDLGLTDQQRILRGLIDYHPRLTPVNLVALRRLHKHYGFEVESVDKALLARTLLEYGDQRLFRSGLDFLVNVRGGPIPMTSLVFLVEYALKRNSPAICEALWEYAESTFPFALTQHTTIMVDLMSAFTRAEKNRSLAKRIARICLSNSSNPSIALGIANVAYKAGDEELMSDLQRAAGFAMTRAIEGVAAQLKAKVRKALPKLDFNAQELSAIVKARASQDLEEAEGIVSRLAEQEEAADPLGAEASSPDRGGRASAYRDLENLSTKKLLTQIALCNQYIEANSCNKFLETLASIRRLRGIDGVILNLKVKWELTNGTFRHARRHYQNFRNVPFKQKSIALATLSQMAQDEEQRLWVAAEQRRLESQSLRPALR